MMNDIQMMAMSFNYYQEVDLTVARELIVYAISEYLSDINNNEEIRPYLHEYPFTAKNIEIRIWIYKPDRTDPSLDKIYYISAINGNLAYYLDLPETHSRRAICEEAYEEAVQAVSSLEEVSQIKDGKCGEEVPIIEVVAKDGANVNIEAFGHEYSIFHLNGKGFKPNESLNFISVSYDETFHRLFTADEYGNILPIGLQPAVIGKLGGVCHIIILREEGSIHVLGTLKYGNQLHVLEPHPQASHPDHEFSSPTFADIIKDHIESHKNNFGGMQ
jgi:hypothetical protein